MCCSVYMIIVEKFVKMSRFCNKGKCMAVGFLGEVRLVFR